MLLRYFTTRTRNRPDKADRQSTYIDALETRGGMECQGTATWRPAVESVKARHPAKRLIAAFPPRRFSNDLARVAHAGFAIGDDKTRGNRLPDPVQTAEGIELRAPAGWLPSNS